jgi:methyltransferase (TIGR00027 family)
MTSTAVGDAFIRAVHGRLAARPLIDDPVSATLLTDAEHEGFARSILRSVRGTPVPEVDLAAVGPEIYAWTARRSAAAPHVILRTHLTETVLRRAVEAGTRQYLMLAAGLETFALRPPDWARDLTIVEVDLPRTQRGKRDRVAAAGHRSVARYVAADLERDDLGALLRARPGWDPGAATFVSLCGVSYYLTRTGLAQVLRTLARTFTGGLDIVLDYWDADHLDPARMDAPTRSMVASVARNGEPFRTAFRPGEWAAFVTDAGLAVRADLSTPQYLAGLGRDTDLRAVPVGRLAELVATR